MKLLATLFVTFIALPLYAGVFEVGDAIPEMCWKDAESKAVCLSQYPNQVKVLLYNTGWCPDCNSEMQDIAPRAGEFMDQPVVFLSLSAQAFDHSDPNPEFLKAWKEKHKIPFPVLASPKDAGKKFIAPPVYIPNVAVVGKDGKLAFKAVGPEIDVLFAEVRKAVNAK